MGHSVEDEMVPNTANHDSSDEEDDKNSDGDSAEGYTDKRRTQNAIFDAWLVSDKAQDVLKGPAETTAINNDAVANLNQSLNSMLIQQQDPELVKNPRDYQIELFERAKKENTIAVLDTGSGKTLIAVLLLRWVIDNELENRAAGKPPKISFFLVASVTLAYQQYFVLESNLDHTVARVVGADTVNRWDKSRWDDSFATNKVFVCTAEILFQCLSRSYISMKQINLLIFDEAHHTKKSHTYARCLVPSF